MYKHNYKKGLLSSMPLCFLGCEERPRSLLEAAAERRPQGGKAGEDDWSIQTRSLARYGWGLTGVFVGLSVGTFLLLMLATLAQRTHG